MKNSISHIWQALKSKFTKKCAYKCAKCKQCIHDAIEKAFEERERNERIKHESEF